MEMAMNTESIKSQLRELRMKTAAIELEEILASQKKTVSLDWLSALLSRELDARRERAVQSRIRRAEFPEVTTLESFDWDFNPDIDRKTIERLATLDFVEKNEIALFLGKPGTGKTHLALALGIRAVHHGHRVFCSSVKRLSQQIAHARAKNSLDLLFKKILSSRLWILDDWGVVSMKPDVAEEVFDLLDRRRHSSALILTSNRDVEEWGTVFPDPVLASAAIDRLFDRATTLTFLGNSYRIKPRILVVEPFQSSKTQGSAMNQN
jgi:DNA replication protein DnaC